MAKKKRLKKKQEKALLQKQVKAQAKLLNISEKEVKQSSYKTLKTLSQKAEKVQTQRKRKRNRKAELRREKANYLISLGLTLEGVSLAEIDKVKVKDIQSGNVNRHTYPNLFGKGKKTKPFNFEKVYSLHGERMYFAFRDFAGETDLQEILNRFENLSNGQLLERLNNIVKQPTTYQKANKKKGVIGKGSSGSAGDYRFMCASASAVSVFNLATYSKNKKKSKRKTHSGSYKGFQILKSGTGNSFSEVTPRGLLIIMNAFMYNITELDRVDFYKSCYTAISKHMPDFAEILPEPQ